MESCIILWLSDHGTYISICSLNETFHGFRTDGLPLIRCIEWGLVILYIWEKPVRVHICADGGQYLSHQVEQVCVVKLVQLVVCICSSMWSNILLPAQDFFYQISVTFLQLPTSGWETKGELKLPVLPMTILSICKLQTQGTLALFLKVLASNQDWKVQWEILDCEKVQLICWLSLLYIVCGQMKQTLINFCIKCNEEITCIHKIAVFCCAFCQ